MKKKKNSLIAMAVVLILLVAAFIGIKQYNKVQANKEPEDTSTFAVNDLIADDITTVSYSYEGETFDFVKDGDTWYAVSDRELSLTQYRIKALATYMAPLTAERQIDDISDLAEYGLKLPSQTITVSTGSEEFTINVGDYNSLTDKYYVAIPGENRVYMVDSYTIGRYQVTLEDLIDEIEE